MRYFVRIRFRANVKEPFISHFKRRLVFWQTSLPDSGRHCALVAYEYFVRNEFQPLVGFGYTLSRSDGSREDLRILLPADRPLVGPFERGTYKSASCIGFLLVRDVTGLFADQKRRAGKGQHQEPACSIPTRSHGHIVGPFYD